jgi:phenylalanyl-tRNA synthetase beta chain
MNISFSWLKEFVQIPDTLSAHDIARDLTYRVAEVEGVVQSNPYLEHVVVGKIDSISAHPNADKLRCCQVNVGSEILPIVCGGSNLEVGQYVAVAKVGARVLWHGQGEPVTLTETAIRGEKSMGMICGADEIGLSAMFPKQSEKEIVDFASLKAQCVAGMPVAQLLGLDDVVLEMDNKSLSNRPDLFGHYGVAREVAAVFGIPLNPYKTKEIKSGKAVDLSVKVEDAMLCPRYTAVVLDNVVVGPSPEWLRSRIERIGLRSINNVVDVSNYIMFELGQPTHCFDAAAFAHQKTDIIVRRAKAGETLEALDEKTYELTSEMLVIADSEKPLAIAGIMGGMHSGVSESTTRIVIESATFDPMSVRTTSTALGLRSDASTRFEKSQDPQNALVALERIVELVQQVSPTATVVSRVSDSAPKMKAETTIVFSPDRARMLLGASIDDAEMKRILTALGFEIGKHKAGWEVTVPSWRATKDVRIFEDLVEEIARIYGYEHISATLPDLRITPPVQEPLYLLTRAVRDTLVSTHRATECLLYSFVSEHSVTMLDEDSSSYLALANPIAKDRPLIRRTLLPNMLLALADNQHRATTLRLFEIGKVFVKEETGDFADTTETSTLPKQDTHLLIASSALGDESPYTVVFEMLKSTLATRGYKVRVVAASHPHLHGGRSASVFVGNVCIGTIGELHPTYQSRAGLNWRTAVAEVNLSLLLGAPSTCLLYTSPSPRDH